MREYSLTRSARKTIGIYIRGGGVEVRAPFKAPKREIDRFVASKEKWITDKLAIQNERAEKREAFAVNYGGKVFLLGVQYPIVARDGRRAGFDGNVFFLPPGLAVEQIKAICVKTYRLIAKPHLTGRARYYAADMPAAPSAIKITGALTRWGSCSAKKNINFSWRLIMASNDIVDYVVVHELAHLTEMNHSARFWKIVGETLPDYQERRRRLREFQKRLSAEDWQV